MNRRLASLYQVPADVPFWSAKGWTKSRRASSGGHTDPDPAGGEGGGGASGSDEEDEDVDDGGDTGGAETVSKAEHEALMRRMQAADRAKSEAEKKLQDIADKDKSELERVTQKVEQLTEENVKLKAETNTLRMENAFANYTETRWKKPGAALKLAKADGYLDEVLQDDGSVDTKAFNKKVSEFAKAYPELVEEKETPTAPPSGGGVGSGGKGKGGSSDEDFRKKYRNLLR